MMKKDLQENIKKLLEVDPREYFTVNNSKFECHFSKTSSKPFSEWKKDENSPSLFCEAVVWVFDNKNRGTMLDGILLIQRDDAALSPLSAVLYIKKSTSESWESMHTITSIII